MLAQEMQIFLRAGFVSKLQTLKILLEIELITGSLLPVSDCNHGLFSNLLFYKQGFLINSSFTGGADERF